MPLPSSGAISLNQMHVEAGGTSGTQCSIQDSDIRALIGIGPPPASLSFNQWYGASAGYSATMTVGSLIVTGDYGSSNYGFNDSSESGLFSTDFGSLSSRDASQFTNSGATIECLFHTTAGQGVRLIVSDNSNISNSGWSTLTIGSSSLSRTAASFSQQASGGQGFRATWTWSSASNLFGTSGTKSISVS